MNSSLIMLSMVAMMAATFLMKGIGTISVDTRKVKQAVTSHEQEDNSLQLVRAEITAIMQTQNISISIFLEQMQCALNSGAGGCTVPSWGPTLMTLHSPILNSPYVYKIDALSAPDSEIQWVDVELSAQPMLASVGQIPVHHKQVRLRLGQNSIFNTAMAGNTFECLFCHATIYGNVAEYGGYDINLSRNTRVHGNWYSLGGIVPGVVPPTITNPFPMADANLPVLVSNPNLLGYTPDYYGLNYNNLATTPIFYQNQFTSYMRGLNQNYQGPNLPFNPPNQAHLLPKFDPETMVRFSTGTISVGQGLLSPYGQVLNSTSLSTVKQTGYYHGNAILIGTSSSPITISGNVFFRGDVIISGVVSGVGNIYSGRNIYIVDDLTYLNSPQVFDGSLSSNQTMDGVAFKAQTVANKMGNQSDQLGLFATNNVVVGDPYPDVNPQNVSATSDGLVDQMGVDVRYINRTSLATYNGLMAQDASTGFMLMPIKQANGTVCFVKPWSLAGIDPCVVQGDPSLIDMTHLVYSAPTAVPATVPNPNYSYFADQAYLKTPTSYQMAFYPENVTNGTRNRWITPAQFHYFSGDSAQIQPGAAAKIASFQASSPAAYAGGAKRLTGTKAVAFSFDQPANKADFFPPDPSQWDINQLMQTIDAEIGLDSQIASGTDCIMLDNPAPAGAVPVPQPSPNSQKSYHGNGGNNSNNFNGNGNGGNSYNRGYGGGGNQKQKGHNAGGNNNANNNAAPSNPAPAPQGASGAASTCVSGAQITLHDAIVSFLNQCKRSVAGDGTANFPYTGLGAIPGVLPLGRDRNNLFSTAPGTRPTQAMWASSNGVAGNYAVSGYECQFFFFTSGSGANLKKNAFSQTYLVGYDPATQQPGNQSSAQRWSCMDGLYPNQFTNADGKVINGCAYQDAAGTHTYEFDSSNMPQTPNCPLQNGIPVCVDDRAYKANSDFALIIAYDDIMTVANMYGFTRYWDPTVIKTRNRVNKVQAYLFANQFISYANDTFADRPLEIDGGMLGQQIAGRYVNCVGAESPLIQPPFNYPIGAPAGCGGSDNGMTPALTVYGDPRFQFSTELAYRDYGTVDFVH